MCSFILLTLTLCQISHGVNQELMTLFLRNGAKIIVDIPINVSSDCTVDELKESVIDCEHKTNGIPKDTLRSSMTLHFAEQRMSLQNVLLSDFGVCSGSVVVYNTNLYRLDGPLVPKLVHHRNGMDSVKVVLQHTDWWIPLNLEGSDLLNAIKSQLNHSIIMNGFGNLPIALQLINSDSSYLTYPPVTEYVGQCRPEWFGQYVIGRGTKLFFVNKDFVKSQGDLHHQLKIQWRRIIPFKKYAVVIRKALFSQLRSSRFYTANTRSNELVVRSQWIYVWDSEPVDTDFIAVQLTIPEGYDVLFDVMKPS